MKGMVVAGAAGRMGREIVGAVAAHPQAGLAGGFEPPGHPELGRDLGLLAGIGELGLKLSGGLAEAGEGARVVIDFTTPESSLANARQAGRMGLATVIGTTGLSPDQTGELARLAETSPILFAPNMSMGVNLLLNLVREAARTLGPDYDLEIVEAHHKMKVDAPSGTALALAKAGAEGRELDLDRVKVCAREGQVGSRQENQIGIQAVRGGDIVGEHTVYLAGPGERLELIHRCHSRSTFAQGAVRAALWVADREPGLFDMQDVLGLK